MARHVASTRLVPQANRLGLASHSQAESALERPPMFMGGRSNFYCAANRFAGKSCPCIRPVSRFRFDFLNVALRLDLRLSKRILARFATYYL
jgi:hypothetical protein